MDLNEYQAAAMETAVYKHEVYPFLGLAEEVGEVTAIIGKLYRKKGFIAWDRDTRTDLIGELGDVLWMLSACASEMGIRLDEIAKGNILKLAKRQEEGELCDRAD